MFTLPWVLTFLVARAKPFLVMGPVSAAAKAQNASRIFVFLKTSLLYEMLGLNVPSKNRVERPCSHQGPSPGMPDRDALCRLFTFGFGGRIISGTRGGVKRFAAERGVILGDRIIHESSYPFIPFIIGSPLNKFSKSAESSCSIGAWIGRSVMGIERQRGRFNGRG
jgi:hypothetical protein